MSVPTVPRPAATILLLRDAPAFEVLMVKRHHEIDFAAGALVFPGGKSHAGDEDPAWAEHTLGWDDFDAIQRALRIAAIREAFEEAGILLARRRDGSPLGGEASPMETRLGVDAGTMQFLEVVRDLDVRLELGALTIFARWITPPVMARRFDTWFYAAIAPDDQLAASDGHETVDAEWLAPAEVLRLEAAGKRKMIFPTRMNVRLLAQSRDASDAVSRAMARPQQPVHAQIETRPWGRVLVLPPEAGYGVVEEPFETGERTA